MVKLKSYEGASQDGAVEYVTLSHRWGDPAKGHRIPPKLTRDNNKDAKLRRGIEVSSLPKTFRDAVLITRTLGLRYLWIDSLCIFQDSVQDWLDEASKMGDIYAGGVFNIAATGSSSSDGGCVFRVDDPRWIPAFQVTETNKPQSDEGRWIELHDQEPVKEDIFSSELFKRGWVHQELHLSPAVLHCTQRQLYWVCTEGIYSERYPQVMSKDGPLLSDELRTDVKSLLLSSLREGNELKTVNVWLHLVEQYSGALLTKPEDKQIAIRGLQSKMTECFNRERQAHFMAGTSMASWLVEQLCWMPNTELGTWYDRHDEPCYTPTWSWVSIGGEVKFMLCRLDESTDFAIHHSADGIPLRASERLKPLVSARLGMVGSEMGTTPRNYALQMQGHLVPFRSNVHADWDGQSLTNGSLDIRTQFDCLEERDRAKNDRFVNAITYFIVPLFLPAGGESPSCLMRGLVLRPLCRDDKAFNFHNKPGVRAFVRCGFISYLHYIKKPPLAAAEFLIRRISSNVHEEEFWIY